MSSMEAGWIISAGLGPVVDLTLALTGVGGAIVAVSSLILGLHPSASEAAPIVLLAVELPAGPGVTLGLYGGKVRYKVVGPMALCGVVISPFGIWVAHRVPNTSFTLLFAVVLAYVAVRMFRQARAASPAEPHPRRTIPPRYLDSITVKPVWTLPCVRALTALGMDAGFLSGLLGVGGSSVIVLVSCHATDLPVQTIVATSLAVIALVSVGGVAASTTGGHVDWHIALPSAAGALTGMLVGRRSAQHLAGSAFQQGFAAFVGVVALGMIVRALI